ncbi:MAG: hypothetical protein ACHP83_00845 [Burkholderiales bacterium]
MPSTANAARHGPPVDLQLLEVDVKCAGKQQHRQHALHENVRKVDGAQQRLLVLPQAACDAGSVQRDEPQRKRQRGGHHPDGDRQPDESVVQVRQQRGDDEADCRDFKHGVLR